MLDLGSDYKASRPWLKECVLERVREIKRKIIKASNRENQKFDLGVGW